MTCFARPSLWFTGVISANGAGSPRAGKYADYSDEEMRQVRLQEQRTAAVVGQYSAMAQLQYSSAEIKDASRFELANDLQRILEAARPQVVYAHNPADKHATHVAVFDATIRALRALPPEKRPSTVYGCEVWRDLDWLPDSRKIALDVSDHENLGLALISVFDSQVTGGKRYDLATVGRRRANATYHASHAVDTAQQMTFAMDLLPLVNDPGMDIEAYAGTLINEFRDEVQAALRKLKTR